ncbi:MAG: glycosidase [Candidatus Bathyarchaeia archaeon]
MNFKFERYKGNPILKPISNHIWEALMVFNCAALLKDDRIHIVYRARGSKGGVSRLGYASSIDGFKIDERLSRPIFEAEPGNELECFGCEDPRLVEIGDRIYLTYTAYGRVPGMVPPYTSIQIGVTSISTSDFLNHKWNWGKRTYPFPLVDNKHACLFPEKIGGRWAMYHRIPPHIWVAYSDNLIDWRETSIVLSPREGWEYFKLGGGTPPLKVKDGWLIIYHAVDREWHYSLGAALIDMNNPEKVLRRSREPVLEPEEDYEVNGVVPNVVFTCGAVIRDNQLILYYGGADTVICVATAEVSDLVESLEEV